MPENNPGKNMEGIKGHCPGGIKAGSGAAAYQAANHGGNIPKGGPQAHAQQHNAKNNHGK